MILDCLLIRARPTCGSRGLALGEALKRRSIGGDRVGDELRVELPGGGVDVAGVVAQLVVARIVPVARLAAELLGLLGGLDALGARGDAAGGDAGADKAVVVAAAVKGDHGVVQAVRLVPVDVEVPQLLGTGRALVVGGVVDLVGKVGRGQHVVVHEQADLEVLVGLQGRGIEVGAQQALLLGGPPGEADAVVDAELGELLGDLDEREGAGTVVVDTRALRDAVGMRSEHDAVVRIALDRLDDDVLGNNLADEPVDVRNRIDSLPALELLHDRLGLLQVDAKGGNVVVLGGAHGAVQGSLLVVVDDGGDGARLAGEGGFVSKGTGAAADQGDVALDLGRVVFGGASIAVDENEIAMHGLLVLGGRREAHGRGRLRDGITQHETVLEDAAGIGGEGLRDDLVVVTQLGDGIADVLEGPQVAYEGVSWDE